MLRYVALAVCFILDAINIYWFSKIFIGAKKLFFAPKSPQSEVSEGAGVGASGGAGVSKLRDTQESNGGVGQPYYGHEGSPAKARRRVEKVFG